MWGPRDPGTAAASRDLGSFKRKLGGQQEVLALALSSCSGGSDTQEAHLTPQVLMAEFSWQPAAPPEGISVKGVCRVGGQRGHSDL